MRKWNRIFAIPVVLLMLVFLSTNLFSEQVDTGKPSLKHSNMQSAIQNPQPDDNYYSIAVDSGRKVCRLSKSKLTTTAGIGASLGGGSNAGISKLDSKLSASANSSTQFSVVEHLMTYLSYDELLNQYSNGGTPPKKTTFLDTDSFTTQWFSFQNATVGDTVKFEWYAPDGTLYGTYNNTYSSVYGWWCSWIYIKGYSAASKLGEWQVKVYRNDSLLFTENFTIQKDTTVTTPTPSPTPTPKASPTQSLTPTPSPTTSPLAMPHIDELSPFFGSPGTTVAITGSNFGVTQGSSLVNFGSNTASINSWNETEIQITVPSLSPETYKVNVTTTSGTSNSLSFLLTEATSEGDFSIDVKPSLQSIVRGSSAIYSVGIKTKNSFNESVTLEVRGLPKGASAEFQRNQVSPGEWVDLTIKTTEKTPLKVHSFIVKGSTSNLNHEKSAKFEVKPAKSVVSLKRSYSSELAILLIAKNKTQKGDKITANISLMNTTGTWMKATLTQEDHSVAINKDEDYVILLGPYATKSLGEITFKEGESLRYDGDRVSFEPLTVLAIDLFLRGALGQEVPPNAFFDVYSHYDYANTLFGDILRKLLDEELGCNSLAFDFGNDLKEGNATGILNDLAEYLQCMGAIKEEMQKLFMQVLKNKKLAGKAANFLNEGVETILGLLQVPDHYVEFKILMCPSLVPPIDGYFESLGLCDTLGSPLDGFVRLEAVAEEKSNE